MAVFGNVLLLCPLEPVSHGRRLDRFLLQRSIRQGVFGMKA